MLYLSKSKYCSAVQCPKLLWLSKYKPETVEADPANQVVPDRGSAVGDLAMGLFGDYVEVPFGDLGDMIRETERLLKAGTPVITEACACSRTSHDPAEIREHNPWEWPSTAAVARCLSSLRQGSTTRNLLSGNPALHLRRSGLSTFSGLAMNSLKHDQKKLHGYVRTNGDNS